MQDGYGFHHPVNWKTISRIGSYAPELEVLKLKGIHGAPHCSKKIRPGNNEEAEEDGDQTAIEQFLHEPFANLPFLRVFECER